MTVLFWFRSSTFHSTKINLNNNLSPIFCTCSIFSLAWFCNILQMDVASKPHLSDAFTASLSMVFYQSHVYTHHHKPRTTKKTLVSQVPLNVNWFLRFSVNLIPGGLFWACQRRRGAFWSDGRKITIKPVLFIENPWNLIRLIFRLHAMKITWSHVSKMMTSSKNLMASSVTKAKSKIFKFLDFP